jgi:GNAT superfamily N-acetyltransferase
LTQKQENHPYIEKLERRHDVDSFDCGQENLNRYLKHYAFMSQRSDVAQTYVGVVDNKIIGYYSLVVSDIAYEDAPERLKQGISRNPVPVMLLARLATNLEWQGKGVGAGLLRNAMQRTIQVADIAGLRSFIVHAKDDRAKSFYEHFDFLPSPTDPYHLYLMIKDIRKSMRL